MRVRRVGASALLIECRGGEQVEAWRRELWRRREAGELQVAEIVPGAHTILLDGVDPGLVQELVTWPPPDSISRDQGPLVEVPTVFDGEDLADVARIWNVSGPEAIDLLAGTEFTVAFCGFAPGFAYMRGLGEKFGVPRLDTPRPRVPTGSVGLAGEYCGIYPTASPGGWRLVGRTAKTLFDVREEPPALLGPGTRVRLVPA
ncbi:carboxyltransferase domain-containing protein [Actinoplanes sp. Pm04-4]|uniref:Carboxyltransferase domain-containing protein n=1 Tax=Paractinoplanes pyxinae TaxID=2997416 RepID=A0ABT4BBG8_9ACTN|nr:carboxyltransferase domain-containing protein [Actinoplanes pyxinae]MCY1143870.1 carboxyltransferase domain-containing protein [Actinoplanes pyxinae]